MPGIYGITDTLPCEVTDATFDSILAQAMHFPWYMSESAKHGSCAHLARISLDLLPSRRQPILSVTGDMSIVMEGELYNSDTLRQSMRLPADRCDAEILMEGYIRNPDIESFSRFLRQVEGRFTAAIWNDTLKKLFLFNDPFASRPVYFGWAQNHFLFGSDIFALMKDPLLSRRYDQEAVAQFFTFGHYLNANTSFISLEVLRPGAIVTCEPLVRRLNRYTYRVDDLPFDVSLTKTERSDAQWVDEIADAFHDSVCRQTKGSSSLGISLSGGLDARSILACTEMENPKDLVSIAMGIPGSADHRLAEKLAQLYGTTHYNYVLDTEFLEHYPDYFDQMTDLTDGQYLSTAIVMPTLNFYRQKGINILLRGHAGELMHLSKAYAFSLSESDRKTITNRQTLLAWCSKHLKAYMLQGVDGELLKGVSMEDFRVLGQMGLEKAIDSCVPVPDYASMLWQMFLGQRVFREIPLSMKKFGSRMEVRLPFLDSRLISLLMAAPSHLKMGELIEQRILEKFRPEFLTVPNVNTGTLIGAPEWKQKVTSLHQRVMAKLGVQGYQPYERMGLWLRRELKEYVSRLVLCPENLDSGLFNPDTLRNIISDHFDGANHTYLIVALMVFASMRTKM